jgi:predicted nucleic acid-binding protein
MILVDTSVIVAWLDENHEAHRASVAAIETWANKGRLAVSAVTFAELSAGARMREHVEEALGLFERLEITFDDAWRAGVAFRQFRPNETDKPVLPDFFIRAQAAARNLPHLTRDRRRIKSFPDVDFEFV